MTFVGLIRKNALRNPLRSFVAVVAVAMALVVFGCISSFMGGAHSVENGLMNRLVVSSRTGATMPLPLKHVAALTQTEGVKSVSHTTRLNTYVGFERNFVPSSAVDPELAYAVFGEELGLTPELMRAFTARPHAVLVGRSQALVQRWGVGDHITLTSRLYRQENGKRDFNFVVAGIFDGQTVGTDTHYVIAQYNYINALRTRNTDTVDTIVVVPEDGTLIADLAPHIDATFANSAAPTRSQTEREFLEAFMAQIADIRSIVTAVILVALITVLLIVSNTMAAGVRERRYDIGVLKAIGLTQGRIAALVLGEALLICALGAVFGTGLSYMIVTSSDPATGMVFSPQVVRQIFLIAALLACLSGVLPCLAALRISPITTLRAR